MESLIITKRQVASIEWNKEKAIKDANEIMKKYEGRLIEETDVPDAKKEIATLRKVSKEINSQALAIDNELTMEVKQFRNEVKEVKAIVDNGISYIDNQVKEFEAAQKLNRKIDITLLDEYLYIKEYVPFNDDWLLKKWTDEKLIVEFETISNQLQTYISTIKMTCNTLNIDSDFYIEKLKTIPYEQVIERINEDANRTKEVAVEPIVVKENESIYDIKIELKCTPSQLKMMKVYAEKIGVIWKR